MTTTHQGDNQQALADEQHLAERLSHFDLFSWEDQRVKWELFDYARGKCPVAHADGNGGFYIVSRYEDVRRVMEDWETFSSTESPLVPTGVPSLCPIDDDPPVQSAARQLLNPLFSRKALAPYEEAMHQTAVELIDAFIDRGSAEILNEYAGPYVGRMLTKVIFNDLTDEELGAAQELALSVAEAATPELFGSCSSCAPSTWSVPRSAGSPATVCSPASSTAASATGPSPMRSRWAAWASWSSGAWTPHGPRSATSPTGSPSTRGSRTGCGTPPGCAGTWTSSCASTPPSPRWPAWRPATWNSAGY
ncbi:hypothetical protein ACR6C2_01580 [Streptomyces sp. INA 01156]